MTALESLKLPSRRYVLGAGMSWEGLKYFRYWIIAAVLISFLGPLAISRYSDIDISTWFYTGNVAKGFTAFVGGGFVYTLVPTMIAASMTRRELSVSMGVFGVLWSAMLGVVVIGGLLAERAFYGAMDWTQGIQIDDTVTAFDSWGETLAFTAGYPLVFLVYFTAGTLIGALAYRWENVGWLLAFVILPVVFTLDGALYGTEPFGPGWMGVFEGIIDGWGRGLVLGAVIVVTVALAAAVHRVLIDIPLRSKKA